MAEYALNERLKELGDWVVENTPELGECKNVDICYMLCSSSKRSNGKVVYADCAKVSDKQRIITPYDFIITAYEPNIRMFTDEQLKILLFHELLHVGVQWSDAGIRKFIRPHDYEDFSLVIERYGYWWSEEGNEEVVF